MKRSAALRHVGLFYVGLGLAMALCGYDPVYQAMFAVMATVAIVGSEILKELGR